MAGPLPQKDGLGASRIRMPRSGGWPTVWEFLRERYGFHADELERRSQAGELVFESGARIGEHAAYRPGAAVFLHREPSPEQSLGQIPILHRDDHLVVVDKPHGMATTPRGRHVTETVVVRLRKELGLPDIAPAHRLDRLTAGVLLLTTSRNHRRSYQELFEHREVIKTYEAVAPATGEVGAARVLRSRVVKSPGHLQAQEVVGSVNAETRIELVAQRDALGHYRVAPTTGRTHQIRVHMCSIGAPIVGDPLYPDVLPEDAMAGLPPLQLLASSLSFRDPVTGEQRCFTSRRVLSHGLTGRR